MPDVKWCKCEKPRYLPRETDSNLVSVTTNPICFDCRKPIRPEQPALPEEIKGEKPACNKCPQCGFEYYDKSRK